MSFVDKAQVVIKAGDGGNGHASFRHEKFIDRGGPDGGDGGDGGDIVFMASRNQNTLANFRFQKELKAESGNPGGKNRRHGKNGGDLSVAVPVGTVLVDVDGTVLADLTEDGAQAVIAKGGKGGYGNAHFVSSIRQAPKVAEKGEPGEQLEAILELKMIADVGLVGLPNAGKSTLLSVVSNARPEIADYPFTTLTPNLGVVDIGDSTSLLIADIPGLIEGAAEGKGLGDEFLRHVERTLVLIHMIDAYQDEVAEAYRTIQAELQAYKIDLTKRPQIVVLNKVEGLDTELIEDLQKQLRKAVPTSTSIMAISAKSGQGMPELLRALVKTVEAERTKQRKVVEELESQIPVLRLKDEDRAWQVRREEDHFIISGKRIEKFAARTDFDSEEGVRRLRDIMKKMGIMHELVRQGIKDNNKVSIGSFGHFEY